MPKFSKSFRSEFKFPGYSELPKTGGQEAKAPQDSFRDCYPRDIPGKFFPGIYILPLRWNFLKKSTSAYSCYETYFLAEKTPKDKPGTRMA